MALTDLSNDARRRKVAPQPTGGGDHLLTDLISLLQRGGQSGDSAVAPDPQVLGQASRGHRDDGLAALLGHLQTLAQAGQPAPANATPDGVADAALSPGGASIDAGGHDNRSGMVNPFRDIGR
jgi:hypothetical protein